MKRLMLLPLVFLLASCAVQPPKPAPDAVQPPKPAPDAGQPPKPAPDAVKPTVPAPKPIADVPLTPFEGKWLETKNQNQPVSGYKFWEFKENTITIKTDDRTYTGIFTYNDNREPKEIDIKFGGFPVNKAIYAIEGNTIHVKLLDSKTERAKKLGVEPGYTFVMCKRVKDKSPR